MIRSTEAADVHRSPPPRDRLPRQSSAPAVPGAPGRSADGRALLLLPWCGFLFFYGLGAGDLYRTEALRAIVAQEFLNSGNWVVPTLYGEPLLTKPPGMYAAIAAVSRPFGGVSDGSARLPSALAATATVFLFFWYFRRLFGTRGGLVAGFVVPASVMWLDKATAAEIDMLQAFWVAGSVLFFLRALEAEEASAEPRAALRWWLAALLCVAGGVLTKWTAPAFFYLTVVPLLWWRGRLRLLWGRNHLLAAALGGAPVLRLGGAGGAAGRLGRLRQHRQPEAMQRLVPHEIPLAAPQHHHRPYPWGEVLAHPFVVLASTLPWSLFALVALWPGFAKLVGRARPAPAAGAALLDLAELALLDRRSRARAAAQLPALPRPGRPRGDGLARLAHRPAALAPAAPGPGTPVRRTPRRLARRQGRLRPCLGADPRRPGQ